MRVWGFILCFLPALVYGRPDKGPVTPFDGKAAYYANLYIQTSTQASSTNELGLFIEKLSRKQSNFKTTNDFLEHIFVKTHHKFLRNFSEYASFSEMLNKGTYNCLTGTALYALILDHFDIRYKIVETNYHIFLLAQGEQGPILFETTDPVSGFVTNDEAIEKRIASYKENSIQDSGSSKKYYRYTADIYNSVNLDQVLGLLHYNLSIAAFNSSDLTLAIDHLGKAIKLYQSPRIEEFSRIILLMIMEGNSNLDPSERERCLESIRSLRSSIVVTASRN